MSLTRSWPRRVEVVARQGRGAEKQSSHQVPRIERRLGHRRQQHDEEHGALHGEQERAAGDAQERMRCEGRAGASAGGRCGRAFVLAKVEHAAEEFEAGRYNADGVEEKEGADQV